MEEAKIRIIHITTPRDEKTKLTKGGVTLAITPLPMMGNSVEIGAAFCSPTEKHFNRKQGRRIAEGRLKAERHGYITYRPTRDLDNLVLADEEIIEVLTKLRAKPRRFKGSTVTGPDWWRLFVVAARKQLDLRRTRKEREAGAL